MKYLYEFITKYAKRQKNCGISGKIYLSLVSTIKEAKIRKSQGTRQFVR